MKYCGRKRISLTPPFQKGFTLMEMMISMVVIAILMAASMPMITQFATAKTGVDKNTMKCITANDSTGWYDTDGNGATTMPATGTVCYSAVSDTQYNRGKALNTALWYADPTHGTSTQQAMAKKVLRAACDQGGEKACDYFIKNCWANGIGTVPYCDDEANFSDITYYLDLPSATNTNHGATYIAEQLEGLLPKMITTLIHETFYDCDQHPGSIACDVAKPEVYIKACNNGNSDACTVAYDPDPLNHLITPYNRSCNQIKAVWNAAPTGNYMLTYNGADSPVEVNCTMTSLPSAAITGCNASPYVADDCTYAYNHNYNQSCSQIVSTWVQAPAGTYNLTSGGAPPIAPVATTCPAIDPNCTNTIGSTCPDGTIFAGNYNGYHLFTTATDASSPTNLPTNNTFTWNNGATNLIFLNATDMFDGKNNYTIITSAVNSNVPYRAEEACASLRNSPSNYGHADWYLPAYNELRYVFTPNYIELGLGNSAYWGSTEGGADTAASGYAYSNNYNFNSKLSSYYVRCLRYETTPNDCSALGVTGTPCDADGTLYAGYYNNRYFFVPPVNEVGSYTWSSATLSTTNATSTTDGDYNTNILAGLTNSETPYKAAKFCTDMNAGAFANYGHIDWYLPSSGEFGILCANRNSIGGFPADAWYWTSTETYANYAAYFHLTTTSCAGMSGSKINTYPHLRCVRREPQ